MKKNQPGFLLLAAGESRRFGGKKLDARLANGLSIFQQTFSNIQAASHNIAVVTRPDAEVIHRFLSTQAFKGKILPIASMGMGESLAYGVQENSAWGGWIICLADMPYVPVSVYEKIFKLAQNSDIARPVFNGKFGHPVFFSSEFYYDLVGLKGDDGASCIINANTDKLVTFETPEQGVLLDIDTQDDIAP